LQQTRTLALRIFAALVVPREESAQGEREYDDEDVFGPIRLLLGRSVFAFGLGDGW
jgi:hypothetical protein